MKKRDKIAFAEIFILIIGIVAFGYVVGIEFEIVRGQQTETYTVKQGDTLREIANDYETTVENLLILNSNKITLARIPESVKTQYKQSKGIDIKSEDYIVAGEKLNVPVKNVVATGNKPAPTATQPTSSKFNQQTFATALAIPSTVDQAKKLLGLGTDTSIGTTTETANTQEADRTTPPPVPPITPPRGGGFFPATSYFQIVDNAIWAVSVYYGVKVFGSIVGLDQDVTDALAPAAGWGIFAGKTVAWAVGKFGTTATAAGTSGGQVTGLFIGGKFIAASTIGLVGGAIVFTTIFLATFKQTKTEKYVFECSAWQPAIGGSKCEECNKQEILGCNEYQCKSLGQSCELINKGTAEEKCADVNRNDVTAPIISTWAGGLLQNYKYTPDNAVSPPTRGVKVEYTQSSDKCVPAFTAFTFGLNTNEPARCKIDYERKEDFEEMSYKFGGGNILRYNHTQAISLPGSEGFNAENITLRGAGDYALYVRCQDAKGNTNSADFVFKFCVDKGPDTTAPLIVTTSIPNEMPVGFGVQRTDLEIKTNEPANCKWSTRDQAYENMEQEMFCNNNLSSGDKRQLYTCTTTLADLKDREDNNYYFKCQDLKGNTNTESYPFTLKGSQPLILDSVGPSGIIKDSTEFVRVELTASTSSGFKEGEAKCQYSETGENEDYIDFFETNSHKHSQDLVLTKGNYKYFIKCFDLAGNTEVKTVIFEVESDPVAPTIVRASKDGSNLKLVTNENAECVYHTNTCNYPFADGTKMASEGKTHLTVWNPKANFYIKCKDEYGNQPLGNECSMIIKPLKI